MMILPKTNRFYGVMLSAMVALAVLVVVVLRGYFLQLRYRAK
jgi:hypothetical protein